MTKKYQFLIDEETYIDIRSIDRNEKSASEPIRKALRWYKYTKDMIDKGYHPIFDKPTKSVHIKTENI